MTKTSVLLMWLVVTGVACALDSGCNDAAGNCTTKTGSNETSKGNSTEQVVATYTVKPAQIPKVLSMIADDDHHSDFRPTLKPLTQEEAKARSINFTQMDEHTYSNELTKNTSKKNQKNKVLDLSDVSMDDEEEEDFNDESLSARILTNSYATSTSNGSCEKAGMIYVNGQKLLEDCDSVCTCTDGKMDCMDRCIKPFVKRGRKIEDPLCSEQAVDDICCATLTCSDTATEALEICSYNNKTFNRGETIRNDCDSICYCGPGGKVVCKARCPPTKKVNEKCVEIPHPEDKCCKTVVCDVSEDEHEPRNEDEASHKILSAKYTNDTTIKIEFANDLHSDFVKPLVDLGNDKKNWTTYTLLPDDYLYGIDKSFKYVRIENGDDILEIQNVPQPKEIISDTHCVYKGNKYEFNQEFNDSCEALCVCRESGVKCFKFECPTYFGIDILDPTCVQWETEPANFTPVPPVCCPEKLKCKNHGECEYEGEIYNNWQEIPTNITGCKKKCYCEMGKVDCQEVCPPVVAVPPNTLPCLPHHAILAHPPGEDCCVDWICQEPTDVSGSKSQGLNETDKISKQKKPFDSKIETLAESSPTQSNSIPSKSLGPLVVYENRNNETKTSGDISERFPNIPPDENHYYSISKHNKPKEHQKNVNELNSHKVSEDATFVGQIHPSFPQYEKSNHPKQSKVNKTKTSSLPNAAIEENYIPDHVIQSYQPGMFEEHHRIPSNPSNINGIQIHGKGPPDELLQFIHQNPQLSSYPPGSILEIHNIPQIPPQKSPQYLDPNTIIPDNPSVPYLVGHPQGSSPPGLTLDHILHEITKNSNFPPNSFAGQNGLLPNNGHVFLPQPVHFGAQPQRNVTEGNFPPGYFSTFHSSSQKDEVVINTLEAVDPYTVKLIFDIPHIIVGLYGRVEVRYTNKDDDDTDSWSLQVFAPPHDLLATPQLEFQLTELKPDTEYRIQVTVTLRDMHNTHTSKIYKVHTPKGTPSSTLPPMIPIEPDMAVAEVNSTWAIMQWRSFTQNEMEFIDGIQLRYKELDAKLYQATPLIHREVTSYTLENLKYKTTYEVRIFFIPYHNQRTELHSNRVVKFTTKDLVDIYGFDVSLDITQVKATSVEISWKGVPYPEDKYVNIYRAVYQSDSGKGDFSTFKVAKRDSPSNTTVMDLKPGTRYRLWLEVYLTNGKIKTSKVQDFITKPGSAPVLGAAMHDKLSGDISEERGDYYGSLVVVAILATVAILSTLVLLLILIRRNGQNKASITQPPRVSQSAYDNPTYKVEIQQETMNL